MKKPLIYIDFKSSPNILTSPILYQNFCSQKNIRTFLRTVREPSEFGRALNQINNLLYDFFIIGNVLFFNRYKHRKGNLQRALKQCKRMQDKKEIHQTIKEDYSNLLTLSKLNEFHRDVTKMSKSIKKKIILNAFKYQGKWYEIHSLPRKLKHFKLQRLIGGSKNYSIFHVEFFHYYLPRYFCICIEKKTFAIN